jgi:predicted RNase H-like HicB family nuclease
MKKVIVGITWTDNNYGAWLESLPGCIATAATLPQVKKNIAEAVEFHLESMLEDGDPIPVEFRGGYELHFKLNTQALLHSCDGLVSQAALSRASGINQQQMSHYYTGHRSPRPEQRDKIVMGLHKIGQELLCVE